MPAVYLLLGTNLGDRRANLAAAMHALEGQFGKPEAVSEIVETEAVGFDGPAFLNCVALKEIDLPAGLQFLGEGAFGYCSMLDRIGLPEENTSFVLENGILYNAKKTKVLATDNRAVGDITLPDTVTAIGAYAFVMSGVAFVSIPDSVTSIGSNAFAYCGKISSISLPNRLLRIGP